LPTVSKLNFLAIFFVNRIFRKDFWKSDFTHPKFLKAGQKKFCKRDRKVGHGSDPSMSQIIASRKLTKLFKLFASFAFPLTAYRLGGGLKNARVFAAFGAEMTHQAERTDGPTVYLTVRPLILATYGTEWPILC